jgi:hypothetical protein
MNIAQLLDGKKTYLVALAAILYLLGAHLGWWPFDDKILDALGFGGLITLRAGVKKAAAASEPTPGVGTRPTDAGPMPSSGAPAPKAFAATDAGNDNSRRRIPITVFVAFVSFCGIFGSGCASVGSNPAADAQRIQRLSTIAELAAFTGSQYWLHDHPQDRQYFAVSLAALDSLLKDRNYDPQALTAALSSLPVRQLQGDKGALIVSAATILYDGYASEVVNLDKATYIAPVIAAIRNGLFRALNPGSGPKAFGLPVAAPGVPPGAPPPATNK